MQYESETKVVEKFLDLFAVFLFDFIVCSEEFVSSGSPIMVGEELRQIVGDRAMIIAALFDSYVFLLIAHRCCFCYLFLLKFVS